VPTCTVTSTSTSTGTSSSTSTSTSTRGQAAKGHSTNSYNPLLPLPVPCRMKSNRESARRARQKRQTRLEELELQVSHLPSARLS